MATKNTDRRDYLIIRRIMKGDRPTQEDIKQYLEDNGCKPINIRTFQRDLVNIRSNYDLAVRYDPLTKGYYLDKEESTRDLEQVMRFVELTETAEALAGSMHERRSIATYISFSPMITPKGAEYLRPLLSAAINNLVVEFEHLKHGAIEATRISAEPYLIKEFDERWYLFAYVPGKGAFRTFGLDRMHNLTVTAVNFERLPERVQEAEKFNSVYGLVYMPDQQNPPVETVRLEFSTALLGHLEALPLHATQTIDDNIVTIQVIVNRELQNKIMSYGEHVQVLAPENLRLTIRKRHEEALKSYL